MPWGEREKVFSKINIFFIFFMLFLFFMVFVTVSNLLEKNLPGVYKTCVEEIKKPALYSYDTNVNSQADAENVLSDFLFDKNLTFVSSSLEECGLAYTFNTTTEKYAICGNGEIYRYWVRCREFTLIEKIMIALKSIRYLAIQ